MTKEVGDAEPSVGIAPALEQRLSEVDRGRDPDGRFRVADFFCHDDSWHLVLQRLVRDSDAVPMDLRGFTRERAGCVFEVHALVSAMRLDRVVFVIDGTTDRPFLEHTVQDAWARDAVGRTGVAVHAKLTLFELAYSVPGHRRTAAGRLPRGLWCTHPADRDDSTRTPSTRSCLPRASAAAPPRCSTRL